ncbi:ImmA/IrrE family metallo-endopeptidase [Pontibacter sp. 172403-2]|uniref:helix-turn-helix domain-containing protein n=1 Tax=Pontibacter rufus TaxID=2791028 RepID=UPI0018AF5B07|nr:XRE family transcriptional regulator [Pontibacter sp. 172403-2]MBF9252166.1 ImmA/IrrE family metallo-endopeptidase [Pontibacter sp. 172403-2]
MFVPKENNDNFNVDEILNSHNPYKYVINETLKDVFERRLVELKMTKTDVRKILNIGLSTLNGLLNGTQKLVDFSNLIKIATFLQLPKEQIILLYINSLEKNQPVEIVTADKVKFIKENFDLAALKQVGFIKSVTDFEEIEKRIIAAFGLKSIFNYQNPSDDVAFSAGIIQPKNDKNRKIWIKAAKDAFKEIDNPYPYNRKALLDFFPEIRWHSTNVDLGLINIIRTLYKFGITVFYQPGFPSLHLRGATLNINHKPCIVLTDYKGFYPTLWFALLHELHHVIFDWEDIKFNRYHISDEEEQRLPVVERENAANHFAREYLFSMEKLKKIRPHLNNTDFVRQFAKVNEVHPSFIYVFHAKDVGEDDRMGWPRATRHNPKDEFNKLIKLIENPWENRISTKEHIKSIKHILYI